MLNLQVDLRHKVTLAERNSWRNQLQSRNPLTRAEASLHLGEYFLGTHYPADAMEQFKKAEKSLPRKDGDAGLAAYDAALAMFLSGRFAESRDAFQDLVHSRLGGYDQRLANLYHAHAAACASYHQSHSALGIPEPPFLDPLCGIAGLAVCLKGRGMDYDKTKLLASVPHDGEGSDMRQLAESCPSLGLYGKIVTGDDKSLMALEKPVVAHVERDHFVAVTRADRDGISYICSDCGSWPGGTVMLTWKQWHAMEPDAYLAVAKLGTTQAKALAQLGAPSVFESFDDIAQGLGAITTPTSQLAAPALASLIAPVGVPMATTAQAGLSGVRAAMTALVTAGVGNWTVGPPPKCGQRGTSPQSPPVGEVPNDEMQLQERAFCG